MSEWDDDGMELDEDELSELRDNPDDITPEDIFKMVMVNKLRKIKVKVELRDKDGDKVELADIVTELIKYMKEQMGDENGNQFSDQILPLVSESLVSTLGRMLGIQVTAFYLSNDTTRTALLWSMAMAFLILKYVQKHGLIIHTMEEAITDEEIEEIERRSEANRVATLGAMLGENPRDILQKLLDEGKITSEDLEALMNGEGKDPNGRKSD